MALTCHLSLHMSTQKPTLFVRPFSKPSRLKLKCIPAKKTVSPSLIIRSCFREKVFEDHSNGIVCYADENGEIICEGIDEGPRYYQPRIPINHRDVQVYEFLQQRWNEFVRETELNHNSVAVQGDLKINGH